MHNILVDRVASNIPKLEFKRMEMLPVRGLSIVLRKRPKTRVLVPRDAFRVRGRVVNRARKTFPKLEV